MEEEGKTRVGRAVVSDPGDSRRSVEEDEEDSMRLAEEDEGVEEDEVSGMIGSLLTNFPLASLGGRSDCLVIGWVA